jgi:hypothetical protein
MIDDKDKNDGMTEEAEQQIGLTQPDAFEQTTSGESATSKRLYADGGAGQEKEANTFSRHAGASSDAPASSGIPSAMRQHGIDESTEPQERTPMADRVQRVRQDTTP